MAAATSKSKNTAPAASDKLFKPGDYVTNPLKKEWGPGRVVDLKRDVVFVYFRDRPGKEVIRMKQSGLRPGERDPELEAISGYVETASGFAVEKGKKAGAKAGKKAARPVIKFEEPDVEELEAEIADLDLDEMEMDERE